MTMTTERSVDHELGNRHRGFTLIELLVVIAIIALLIGILLPALGRARQAGQKAVSGNNQRQTLVGMATFGSDSDGFFPGVERAGGSRNDIFTDASDIQNWTISGARAGMHAPTRFLLMLQDQYIDGESLKSPAEPNILWDANLTGMTIDTVRVSANNLEEAVWVDYQPGGWLDRNGFARNYNFDTVFYSYALLDLINEDVGGGVAFAPLCKSWSIEASSLTPIMSDRMIIGDAAVQAQYQSLWQGGGPENKDALDAVRQSLWTGLDRQGWEGHVAYGDAHVEYRNTSILAQTEFAGKVNTGSNNKQGGAGNTNGMLDRTGDDMFSINSGYGARTQDAGMIVGWGSQTFRHGGSAQNGPR